MSGLMKRKEEVTEQTLHDWTEDYPGPIFYLFIYF